MENTERVSLAVLIDAENVSHRQADKVFALAEKLGELRVRRLYGNAAGWDAAIRRHAVGAGRCLAPAAGKNGADIALAVDAVDLLHDGVVAGFCIVSSDGDFSSLAWRIRDAGKLAYGIGLKTAARGYRDICTQFFGLDPVAAPAKVAKSPHEAVPALRQALAKVSARDEWYHLGAFGLELSKAGFDPKRHGHARLGALLRATGQFTFKGTEWFRPTRASTQLRAV